MGCSCGKTESSEGGGKEGEINLKEAIDGKKKLCIWILGGPGSGKGTQCQMLAVHFKLAHLSTGDLLREIVKKDTPLAKDIKSTMEKGALVDSSTVLKLLMDAMTEAYPTCNGFLIDGYPREVSQGEIFCEKVGTPHVIIYLECPDDILMERLLKRGKESGRVDDNEETIKARLETFHGISQPVIDRWKDIVINVDGTQAAMEVEKECTSVIQKYEKEFGFQ